MKYKCFSNLDPESHQPQAGPGESFHSQGDHGAETPMEGQPPAAGTPLGDAYGSAACTPPTVTKSQIGIQSTSHYGSAPGSSCSVEYNVAKCFEMGNEYEHSYWTSSGIISTASKHNPGYI